jgi:two-component system OmpR family response regulator
MNRIRVLVVDDDTDTRSIVSTWLERCGFAVEAVDGIDAADHALASGHTFDVMLSDVMMPGNTRLEWIERRLAERSLPPVLLMTGTPELATAMRAANLPVAGYLVKPFDFATIRSQIERLASHHRRSTTLHSLSYDLVRRLQARLDDPSSEPDPLADELFHLACELTGEVAHCSHAVPTIAAAPAH